MRVVGASHTGLSSLLYHITLEATEGRRHRIFHAVVWLQPLKNSKEVLVWKRVYDALATIGIKCGKCYPLRCHCLLRSHPHIFSVFANFLGAF